MLHRLRNTATVALNKAAQGQGIKTHALPMHLVGRRTSDLAPVSHRFRLVLLMRLLPNQNVQWLQMRKLVPLMVQLLLLRHCRQMMGTKVT